MKHTLIENFDHHPEWCKQLISVKSYKNFNLGETVFHNKDIVIIIHIGVDLNNEVYFRLKLNNGASITGMIFNLKKIKGNPVPSLDWEKFKTFLSKKYGPIDWKSNQGWIKPGFWKTMFDTMEEFIQQNGVETNKEQPKTHPYPLCGNSRNCDDACMTGEEYDRLMR